MRKVIFFIFLLLTSVVIFGCTPQGGQQHGQEVQPQQLPAADKGVDEMVVAEEEPGVEESAEPTDAMEELSELTIFEVKTSGFTFTPNELTIKKGNTVKFVLGSIHDVVEVDKETWDANKNTVLKGGFNVPFGGTKEITFDKAGTYYYVCQPHASLKMKGMIVVE